jgi:hypothetical protein
LFYSKYLLMNWFLDKPIFIRLPLLSAMHWFSWLGWSYFSVLWRTILHFLVFKLSIYTHHNLLHNFASLSCIFLIYLFKFSVSFIYSLLPLSSSLEVKSKSSNCFVLKVLSFRFKSNKCLLKRTHKVYQHYWMSKYL